jgi:hypothetical protein
MTLNEPLDELHADSLAVIATIRSKAAKIAAQIAAWEPQTCPPAQPPVRNRSLPETAT